MSQLMKLSLAQAVPMALKAFVEIGIPDILLEAPSDGLTINAIIEQLKDKPEVHHDSLSLTLRILSTVGIVVEESAVAPTYHLTVMGKLLTKSHQSSLDPMIRYFLDEPLWNAWGALPSYMQAQQQTTPFESANGMPSQQYYSMPEHTSSLKHAGSFVSFVSQEETRACVEGFDWATLNSKTIVDLGGHSGQVMRAVGAKFPSLKCICLDLPEVIKKNCASSMETEKNGAVVQLVGGDMFDPATIPPCDAIFMKHVVLCDWNEAKSRAIMKSCHEALPPSGLAIIAEAVLPSPGSTNGQESLSLLVDYFMTLDGRSPSKTSQEWQSFAESTGFKVLSIQHTSLPTCSILVLQKQTIKEA
ncbi:(RS)-norcoclaurine 6-O-methyltransferase [Seminavis robusta]|uniref:(RS)-norcoclaurine 6-O-methyltransferase n=1 Tax=Seminavis robusta TaxID=568900 RepID=A0A9N8H7B3_9STRA|nr:(RS)-norcoclaurine 6-O-methyltransferase [Seminavis robusta]|eukprot:Sro124_g059790.1 (RS)-norcoclaurine 6-O-methyltransferase (359) ;mRNA; f:14530-15606